MTTMANVIAMMSTITTAAAAPAIIPVVGSEVAPVSGVSIPPTTVAVGSVMGSVTGGSVLGSSAVALGESVLGESGGSVTGGSVLESSVVASVLGGLVVGGSVGGGRHSLSH